MLQEVVESFDYERNFLGSEAQQLALWQARREETTQGESSHLAKERAKIEEDKCHHQEQLRRVYDREVAVHSR